MAGLLLVAVAIVPGRPAALAQSTPTAVQEIVQYVQSGDYVVERRTWVVATPSAADAGPDASAGGVASAQYRINSHSWPASAIPVTVYYNGSSRGSNPDAAPLIQTDIARWNAVTTAFSFKWSGATDQGAGACDDRADADGLNTITYSTRLDPGVLGRTCTLFRDVTSPLVEFDMEINVNGPWASGSDTPTGKYDLQSTLLHELGHAAGIAHPCGSGTACTAAEKASVMYAFLDDGVQKRLLTGDDTAALQALYPGGAVPTPAPTPIVIPQFKREFQAHALSIARD